MIKHSPVMEDELHAYVDGELPANRRGAVETWLSAHPEDAARVGAWRAQAEMIRARYAGLVHEPVAARFDLDRLRRLDRRWWLLAAAAVIAGFLLGGASGWLGRDALPGGFSAMKMLTADAIEAHKLYVVEVRHPVEVPGAEEGHLMQWLSKRLGYDLPAPNLGILGLKLVGGRLLPGPSGAAALLMYEGASGERFTFYCSRSRAPETALRYLVAGPVASFYWIDDDKGYVVSGPPERDRLLKVAQSIYEQLELTPVAKNPS